MGFLVEEEEVMFVFVGLEISTILEDWYIEGFAIKECFGMLDERG